MILKVPNDNPEELWRATLKSPMEPYNPNDPKGTSRHPEETIINKKVEKYAIQQQQTKYQDIETTTRRLKSSN